MRLSFNRPKAISCLATQYLAVIPAGETASFNRPKAISCLATCLATAYGLTRAGRFNRPKAISCLATAYELTPDGLTYFVSIARRRLVVLRLGGPRAGTAIVVRFNRPKAISCLATPPRRPPTPRRHHRFNRPKAISCLATALDDYLAWRQRPFQSPEGD